MGRRLRGTIESPLFIIMGELKLFCDASKELIYWMARVNRHGGYGYQASWGCADKVLEILSSALANVTKSA